jgi:hypothetical protein
MTAAICGNCFSSGGSRSIRRRQDGPAPWRHLDTRQRPGRSVGPLGADQHLGFCQGSHALLQEERVPLGALDQALFEELQTRIVPRRLCNRSQR